VDASKRNRYLDAMGVDVWVRRPGAVSAGLWVDPPEQASTQVSSEVTADVPPASAPGPAVGLRVFTPGPVEAAEPVASTHVSAAALEASPVIARAPAGDEAARWEALRSEVLSCTRCPLHKTRTQGVLGVGPHRTDWMVIGEAPGAEEDRRGEPFVGRAGHLLDAMLQAIGLNRGTNVYIANVLKSRPPNNRDPKPEEVAACLPYLMRQIALLQPRLMLAVGRIAAQNLLATDLSLSRLRGKVHHFGELNTPLIVTYHPAYLLRTPSDKRKAWEDLKFARTVFRQLTDRAGIDGHLP
jgi:uracil-DNA glycosylase family 4